MTPSKQSINRNWFALIITALISFLVISFSIIYSDILQTKLSSERFKTYVKEEKKKEIKREVKHRIDEIHYEQSILQRNYNQLIKGKIIQIEDLLLSRSDIDHSNTVKVIEEFERIIESDKAYLYFALNAEGVLLRSGTDNSINGISIINNRDKDGVYFTREMIKAVNRPDGIYVTYHWPKVKDGEPLKKTSYARYIPELGLIIGTGIYEEDMLEELQNRIYSRLIDYYRNSESYIFVTDYSGYAKVHSNSSLIGSDMTIHLDYNNDIIHQKFMALLTTRGSGYLTYPFQEKNSDIVSEKISYVERLGDKWDAYIGMGFHTRDLLIEMKSYEKQFQQHNYREFFLFLLLFSLMAVAIIYFIRRGNRLQKLYLRQEELIFEELFEISPEAIMIISNKGEILFENKHSRRIFGEKLKESISHDGRLIYEHVDEHILKVINEKQREYYVHYRVESIIFQNSDSLVYFLSDITKSYIKSNMFMQQALYDELTGLPNRRKLLNDIDDMESSSSEHIVLVMLDLDHFKVINDTYGHDMGDQILKILADVTKGRLRDSDEMYRYGGEEFIILLENINLEFVTNVLNFLNSSFNKKCQQSYNIEMTFSAGAVLTTPDELDTNSLDDFIKQADRLLYKAKESGRNRIETEL